MYRRSSRLAPPKGLPEPATSDEAGYEDIQTDDSEDDPLDRLDPALLARLRRPDSLDRDRAAWDKAFEALCARDAAHCSPDLPTEPAETEMGAASKVAVMERRVNATWEYPKGVVHRQHDGPPEQCFHPLDGAPGWVRTCYTSDQNSGLRAGLRPERGVEEGA